MEATEPEGEPAPRRRNWKERASTGRYSRMQYMSRRMKKGSTFTELQANNKHDDDDDVEEHVPEEEEQEEQEKSHSGHSVQEEHKKAQKEEAEEGRRPEEEEEEEIENASPEEGAPAPAPGESSMTEDRKWREVVGQRYSGSEKLSERIQQASPFTAQREDHLQNSVEHFQQELEKAKAKKAAEAALAEAQKEAEEAALAEAQKEAEETQREAEAKQAAAAAKLAAKQAELAQKEARLIQLSQQHSSCSASSSSSPAGPSSSSASAAPVSTAAPQEPEKETNLSETEGSNATMAVLAGVGALAAVCLAVYLVRRTR